VQDAVELSVNPLRAAMRATVDRVRSASMHSTPTAKPNDDPHDVLVVAPDAVRVAPEDELSSLLHEAAARYGAEMHTREGPGVKDLDPAAAPAVPPVDTTFRPTAVNGVPVAGKPWPMVRQAARGFTALLLATCIGVAAFVWRSYGDAAERKIAKWTTQLVLTASLPPEKSASPSQEAAPAVVADAANVAPPQPAAPAQTAPQAVAPATAAPSADSAQLQSMSRDLASLGQEVEQLKASIEQLKIGQQQMSRDVAKVSEVKASEVKASEQSPRPKISALPPRPAVARPRNPTPAYAPRQAAAPALPPAAAPYPAPAPYYPPNYAQRQADYLSRPPQSQPQYAAEPPPADPELSSVPRPPMPLRE
jgi:hypothetical protein